MGPIELILAAAIIAVLAVLVMVGLYRTLPPRRLSLDETPPRFALFPKYVVTLPEVQAPTEQALQDLLVERFAADGFEPVEEDDSRIVFQRGPAAQFFGREIPRLTVVVMRPVGAGSRILAAYGFPALFDRGELAAFAQEMDRHLVERERE